MTLLRCFSLAFVYLSFLYLTVLGQPTGTDSSGDSVVIGKDETVSDIVVRGRSLDVLGQVNGSVLILGSDAVIEGRVERDATVLGGSLIQRNGGFIGGNVIVLGGSYTRTPDAAPLKPEAKTIVIREYGEYLRDTFQHPWRRMFIPQVNPLYVGQRILGFLFYFLIALLLIALVPAQLNRANQALKYNYLRVGLIGFSGLSLSLICLLLLVRTLPIEVAAPVTLFVSLIMLGGYFFGSLAVHLLVGRWIQQRLRQGKDHSHINALLYGMALFAVLFSIPVLGMVAALALAILSFGIAVIVPMRHSRPST
jgi:hypothetical protein